MNKLKYILIIFFLTNNYLSTKSLHPLFTRDEMGNFVWIIMHLYSAFFPENPTKLDTYEYQKWIYYLGKHFPCKECSNHFLEMVKKNPIDFKNREEMMKYLCKIHNIVNKKLNKELFDCNTIKEVWGQKDCGCSVKNIKEQLNVKQNK